MNNQLLTHSNNKTFNSIKGVVFTLALMFASMTGRAQTAYITNSGDSTISVINVVTNTVINTITVSPIPFGVAVSADGSKVYVTSNYSTIRIINTATNAVSAPITVGLYPDGISVLPDESKIYVANTGDNTVSVINAAADTVSATVTVGAYPYGVAVSPDGSRAYVTVQGPPYTVSVINTATDTVLASITVGNDPLGIAVSPDGSKVYVTNSDDGTVSVINAFTDSVSATIVTGIGNDPWGISVSPNGNAVYVANNGDSTISVINTATDTVSAIIAVGGTPLGISVSPDGSKVYVANDDSIGTVSVINAATNSVTDIIRVGSIPGAFGNFISSYKAPQPCSLRIDSVKLPSCNYCSDGCIITQASGGTPPYAYTWSPSISDDSSALDLVAGYYTVCMTDSAGCYICDTVTLSFPLLVQNMTSIFFINIYPNPAADQLTIHTSSFHNEAVMVSVVNVLGQMASPPAPLLWRGEDATIDVSGLAAGMYFVEMKTESGSVVKRFVKE